MSKKSKKLKPAPADGPVITSDGERGSITGEGTALQLLEALLSDEHFLAEVLEEKMGPDALAGGLAEKGRLRQAVIGTLVEPADMMMIGLALVMSSLDASRKLDMLPPELRDLVTAEQRIPDGFSELTFNSAGFVEKAPIDAAGILRMLVVGVLTGLALGEGRPISEILDDLVSTAPDDDKFALMQEAYLQAMLAKQIEELNAIPTLDHDPEIEH